MIQLSELFSSGRIIDVILVLMAIQATVLLAVHRRTGTGMAPADYFINLLPGACLMLALRAALVNAHWTWVALCLVAALLAHWLELWRRIVVTPATYRE